jgi:hypothetical protein
LSPCLLNFGTTSKLILDLKALGLPNSSKDAKQFIEYLNNLAKNQFAMFMESLAFNLKRMVILNEEYGF